MSLIEFLLGLLLVPATLLLGVILAFLLIGGAARITLFFIKEEREDTDDEFQGDPIEGESEEVR